MLPSDTAGDGLPRESRFTNRAVRRSTAGVHLFGVPLFAYRSTVPASAVDLFQWHERPEAVLDLIPGRRWVRIEEQIGGLRDGGRVIFSIGVGPLRVRWAARHFGYVPNTQFCDEQVRGPFAMWRHTHRIESIGAERSLYEDSVEYAVPGGRLVNLVVAPLLRPLLSFAFSRRHKIVRDSMRQLALNRTTRQRPTDQR